MAPLDQIKGIVSDELAVDESDVVMEAHLMDDLDADSMNLLVIYTEIEKLFDIKIDDKVALQIKTVGDLVALVEKKGE